MPGEHTKEWVARITELHQKWRSKNLAAGDRAIYLEAREELARTLLAAQRKSPKPGQSVTDAFRIARALPVEVKIGSTWHKCLTTDIGMGGFATNLPEKVAPDTELGFRMGLPGKVLPMVARCRLVTSDTVRADSHRATLVFTSMRDDEKQGLETMVYDMAIAQLRRLPT